MLQSKTDDNNFKANQIYYEPTSRGLSAHNSRQKITSLRLQLHDAIYRPDSFVMMPRYYANLKAIRYESTSLNRIVADKSPRVIVT